MAGQIAARPSPRQPEIKKANPRRRAWEKYRVFYFLALIPTAQIAVFTYAPMRGIAIAFKDFKITNGIGGSLWVGLKHFQTMFSNANFKMYLGNTIRLSFVHLVFSFAVTIIFALLLNELQNPRYKKIVQTISYIPYFLSWVVVAVFVEQVLSPRSGIVNVLLLRLGVLSQPKFFMVDKNAFMPIYVISSIWKGVGYGVIIYLAGISGINPELFESAHLDGANRFQRVLHITLPCLAPLISTLLILNAGQLINVGFDPIFNLMNDSTRSVAEVLSTYVYKRGIKEAQYDFSTAVGLFQNTVSLALVLFANFLARRTNHEFRVI